MKRESAVAILLALALSLPALAAVNGSFERTLKVSGPVQLEVKTGSGDIHVRKGDDGSVRVYGKIRASEGFFTGTEEVREKVRRLEQNPPIEQSGNRIRIGFVEDHELFNNVSISYEIVVPAETQVTANTGSGNMEVERVHGAAKLHSGSGNVTASNIDGDVDAQAGSGAIELSVISGNAVAHTGSGHIKLERVSGVDAHTGSGGINILDMKGRLRAHAGSGDITAEGAPTGEWNVETGSGSVTLRLTGSGGFDFHARTGSGGIESDLPITISGRQDRHEISGKIRGGGPMIDVRTGSGRVHLQ
ncbi:MAG: DUF4097 domain-containing protein [Acidobacteriia bacterium]|nr:DUF4097 domain-containing protein [Terriglobia bacterium]